MKQLLGVLPALLLWVSSAGAQTETFHVHIQGAKAGELSLERGSDGTQRSRWMWKNNGRGPEMEESFAVDAAQTPVRFEVRGKAMYGNEIREEFQFADGRLRWTSVVDRGDEAAAPGTLFVPLESTPAYVGQIARALLARPDRQAPAPGGAVLTIERLLQMTVGPAPGVPVALLSITGGDSNPWYLWLRDDGSQRLFGFVFPGWQLLPEGLDAVGPALLERQLQAQGERLKQIQQRTSQPLPGLTRIHDVRWFDSAAARMRGPADIYLQDGRIGAITAPGALTLPVAQQIDGRGRTLLPGLLDLHAHMGPESGLLHLAAGVTTVRDMANENDQLALLMQRIAAGEVPGPNIVPAGFIEGRSPFSARYGIVADTLDQALAAVDHYAARGYRQIKLYNSIKPEWVAPLARRAHALGMTVAGHVPAFMRAEQAVRAGYDELTHINQLMLNFFVKPSDDTRTLLRFTLPAEKTRDVKARDMQRFVALLKKKGTAVDATMTTFEGMFTQRNGEVNQAWADIASHLPVLWRRGLLNSEMGPTDEQVKRYRESWQRMQRFVGDLHRAGITLVAGTDDVPGLALQRELILYTHSGIPPAEVLKIATWNGARVAGVADRAGSIARGRPADLLLVDGDPSVNIGDIRKASLVIKGGLAYSPAALYEAQGIRPFVKAAVVEKVGP